MEWERECESESIYQRDGQPVLGGRIVVLG